MNNFSLLNLTGDSWLVPGPTNIGVYVSGDSAYLIDSGNDKDAGRRILKIIAEMGWNLKAIINTHSNADHIGANNYLQGATGCEIWATAGESAFIEMPSLESSLLWGGFPFKELRSKFFEAKPSKVTRIIDPSGGEDRFTFIPLPGHFINMVGILTKDRVAYLGDSLFGEHILEKYKIPFIYDVRAFKSSLASLLAIQADWFVPSHGEARETIGDLVEANAAKVGQIEADLLSLLRTPSCFEDLLAGLCSLYGIALDFGQYALDGSTVRSFLSCLRDEGKADYRFENNRMLWMARSS